MHRKLVNEKGFTLLGALVAVGLLAIVMSAMMSVQGTFLNWFKKSSNVVEDKNKLLVIRDWIDKPDLCKVLFEFNGKRINAAGGLQFKLNKSSLPTGSRITEGDFVFEFRNSIKITTENNINYWYTELFSKDNNSAVTSTANSAVDSTFKYMNNMYFETNMNDEVVDCYLQPSAKSQCTKLGGQFVESSKECKILMPGCPAGFFLVSADANSWKCRDQNGTQVDPQ